ncbi:arginyltransferase [Zavarzinia compransoris]|uniref:arginyltransferase n=1 Tax=Zavarzinia marina TaxID=2911065 RepID=UPI001F2609DB|nr:arginyltransferase [Zavarzinia marina]MCF4164285.1 arginyltransferase [Zavarzinia marina]
MTEHPTVRFPYFFVTVPAPCPYLPGRMERKVFTRLNGDDPVGLNDALTHAGFRRSQGIAYKPACDGCQACVSVRVPVDRFTFSRNSRRIRTRNADLRLREVPPFATEEQFALLRHYLEARHPGGGMVEMDALDFAAMIEDSPIDTHVAEYRDGDDQLLAACLVDRLADGLSLVYSFFDPDDETRSLGTNVVLSQIERARILGLPYVYLGYWIEGCRKMVYKARYQPLEGLGPDGWQPLRIEAGEKP